MKNQRISKIIVVAFTCVCTLATGCTKVTKDDIQYMMEDGFSVEIGTKEEPQQPSTMEQSGNTGQPSATVSSQGETREVHELGDVTDTLVRDLGGHFAYDRLNDEEQTLYRKILDILLVAEKEITVPSLDSEQIDFVFNCVLMDHPELFYVSGYSFTKYSVNGNLSSIDFSGTYTMDEGEITTNRTFIDIETEAILANIPSYTSDYDLAKYFYEVIILNTDYNLDSINNQNICSVFLTHESVCQGYAKALQFLLQLEGIESVLVTGQVSGGEGHAWVLASLDGAYYHIDPTWGDASYNADTMEEVKNLPEINYDYLCVTTHEINESHKIQSVLTLPECTALDDNYYVREGLYFAAVDTEYLHSAFDRAYNAGQSFLTIKCSDSYVYAEMANYLLNSEDAHVFEYLRGDMKQVVYSMNDKQFSISIWLE